MQSAIEMYILKLKFFAYLYVLKFHYGSYLDQEPQVNILTFGLLPVNLTVLVVSDVNSLLDQTQSITLHTNKKYHYTKRGAESDLARSQ